MKRFGIQLKQHNIYYLVITAILATITGAALKITRPEFYAAIMAFVLLTGAFTYRSRTALGWVSRRWTYRRTNREKIFLYPHENSGISWDGNRASAYVEILPQPFEFTVVGSLEETTVRSLPVDDIREELVQFDIHCDAVTLVTMGHKYDRSNQIAMVYHSSIGPIPALLYGRTFAEISIALDESIDSIYARQFDDGAPAGLSRTVGIAAERIRRRLAKQGWKAKRLNQTEVEVLNNQISAILTPAMAEERWGSCGPATMRAVAFTPAPASWTAANYREWCQLDTHRQLQILRLDRRRRGGDHAEMYLAYVTDDSRALNTLPALGLGREYSQQGDILTAAMPLARTVRPTAVSGKQLAADPFPFELHAGGIGTFLGHTRSRAQVFVNFTTGGTRDIEELGADGAATTITQFIPFHVVGASTLCQHLLLRIATSGRTVDVQIPGEHWRLFASRVGATYKSNPDADIIVVDAATAESADAPIPTQPDQVEIVWAAKKPSETIEYGIIAGTPECTLMSPTQRIGYTWEVSSAEQSYFTEAGPRHAA